MGYFGDAPSFRVRGSEVSLGPTSGIIENLSASYDEARLTETFVSEGKGKNDIRDTNRTAIESATGKPFDEAISPFMPPQEALGELNFDESERAVNGILDTDRATDDLLDTLPDTKRTGIVRSKDFDREAKDRALEAVAKNADVYARSIGVGSGLAQFLGAAGAQFTDPLVIGTLPIGASSSARIIVAGAIEAALAAGVTAAQLPVLNEYRERLGLPAGFNFAVQTIGTAAVAGGVLGAGFRAIGKGISRLRNSDLLQLHKDLGIKADPDQVLMIEHLSRKDHEARVDNTYNRNAAGEVEHAKRLKQAVIHVDQKGNAVELPPAPDNVASLPKILRSLEEAKKLTRNTRGEGTQYHGSSSESIELGDIDDNINPLNFYGQGFYSTEALDIANGYAGRKGSIFTVEENGPVKLYDMEQPIDDELKAWIVSRGEARLEFSIEDAFAETSIDLSLPPVADDVAGAFSPAPKTLREFYERVWERGSQNNLRGAELEITEDFLDIQDFLAKRGFQGFRHLGGSLTRSEPHNVKVYWNPDRDITVTKLTGANRPKAPLEELISEAEVAAREAEANMKARQVPAPWPPPSTPVKIPKLSAKRQKELDAFNKSIDDGTVESGVPELKAKVEKLQADDKTRGEGNVLSTELGRLEREEAFLVVDSRLPDKRHPKTAVPQAEIQVARHRDGTYSISHGYGGGGANMTGTYASPEEALGSAIAIIRRSVKSVLDPKRTDRTKTEIAEAKRVKEWLDKQFGKEPKPPKPQPAPPIRAPAKEEVAATEKQGDPMDAETLAAVRAQADEIRRDIERTGDFDVEEEFVNGDGEVEIKTRKASKVLKEFEDDTEFLEQLEACAK